MEQLGKIQEFLKGYKTHILLAAFILVTLANGQAPMEGMGSIFNLEPEAMQKALAAGVVMALKAWANRTFGPKDGLEVTIK